MQVESKKDEIIIKKFLEHIKQIMLRKKNAFAKQRQENASFYARFDVL